MKVPPQVFGCLDIFFSSVGSFSLQGLFVVPFGRARDLVDFGYAPQAGLLERRLQEKTWENGNPYDFRTGNEDGNSLLS